MNFATYITTFLFKILHPSLDVQSLGGYLRYHIYNQNKGHEMNKKLLENPRRRNQHIKRLKKEWTLCMRAGLRRSHIEEELKERGLYISKGKDGVVRITTPHAMRRWYWE